MRIPAVVLVPLLLLLALASAAVARADTLEERRAAAAASVAALADPDPAVRAMAADRLAEIGRPGAEALARDGATLDEATWKTCADAFVRAKARSSTLAFVLAARSAPEAHGARLLALARALDPRVGMERTPEEVAAEVKRLLDDGYNSRCSTGYDESIALLGRAAVKPLLDGLRELPADHEGDTITCWALALLAEKEDVPAFREQLLAGRTNIATALGGLQERGVSAATDALLESFAARGPDGDVVRALETARDRDRVLATARKWIVAQDRVKEADRRILARLFRDLDARDAAPLLAEWLATSKDPDALRSIAEAFLRFGDPRGVGLCVRMMEERKTAFPCRPSTEEERTAASAPGRLCPSGFDSTDRGWAMETVAAIAGKEVFEIPDRWLYAISRPGPGHEEEEHFLGRASAAFRKWWDASKDRLRFDAEKGAWVVGG